LSGINIHNRWPIARAGLPFILVGLGLTFISLYASVPVVPFFFFALTLMTIYFFRDPQRSAKTGPQDIVSPADGKVIGIVRLGKDESPTGQPCTKISIFMSVFDVHVNRVPFDGMVADISYRPGAFLSADTDKASSANERNSITLITASGEKIGVAQIAGLIARRISCWIAKGDRVCKGQRFGLIRFGSRVELYLPGEAIISVSIGDRVKAGLTLIGVMK
jgi:phosphatidylserine decarboxylase